MVMNYICKLRARPGELSLVKCVEKGVPPGPLLGKLKNGEDVQLANGTIVRSVDVCNPDDPGPIFMGKIILIVNRLSGSAMHKLRID